MIRHNSLRIHRERQGLSVEYCARTIGVATRTWYRWEAGSNQPTVAYLFAAARLLGVPVEVLSDLAERRGAAV